MGVIHTETVMNGVISILLSFFLHTFILAETVSDVTNSESLEEMMPLDQVETVEGFMRTREFKAIVGGCACFWGSILGMGMTYMLVVLLKRSFEPQEIAKEED